MNVAVRMMNGQKHVYRVDGDFTHEQVREALKKELIGVKAILIDVSKKPTFTEIKLTLP